MNITRTIIVTSLIFISTISYSQFDFRNMIEISYDYGYSTIKSQGGLIRTFAGESIIPENKSSIRTRNSAFSYTRYFNPNNGLKLLFGHTRYGFHIQGTTDISNTPINEQYRVTYLEWGLSYVLRISISQNIKFRLEPGICYHSDGSPRSTSILFFGNDAFSFSGYTGIEVPMLGNHLFSTIGLQVKLPLQKYNYEYDITPENNPYFIGLKVGVNFQF